MALRNFNFFRTLDKDNKELVHSAFIKYLMQYNDIFYTEFIKTDKRYVEPKLEKQYTLTKKQKGRVDIESVSEDNSTLVIIENKFKSFPYQEQFLFYDRILKKHHKDKKIIKLLICFDKEFAENYSGWIVRDYRDLLTFIAAHYPMDSRDDHSVFIRHYYNALNEYFQEYGKLEQNFRELFLNLKSDSNKFWLKLFYSALKVRLETYISENDIDAYVYINNGNTTVPLLNIVPKSWNIHNNELLIQLQGNDIKFYSHSNNKPFLSNMVEFARLQFPEIPYEYKKESNRNSKTQFILKTKVLDEIPSIVNVDFLFELVIKFYTALTENVILKYDNVTSYK